MVRWFALLLVLISLSCGFTTSHTRTGTGLFAPRPGEVVEKEEEEAPRGLSLSIASIARDGTVTLELRNYSMEPFVFHGTPDRPQYVVEVQSGDTQSRHRVAPWSRGKTHEVPAGERVELKANIDMISGRVRIGIRHQEFGYTVWTSWITR